MSIVTRTLVLTGGRAGMTIKLGKFYQFTDGKATIRGSSPDVEALTHYLGVNFAAYPEGSAEVEASNGERNIPADGESDEKHPILSGAESEGEGTPQVSAPDGSGADGAGTGTPDGHLPEGCGHEDSRVHRIEEALSQLDTMDDEHWTTTGEPSMAAVEAFLGEKITRAELKKTAPDFNREG